MSENILDQIDLNKIPEVKSECKKTCGTCGAFGETVQNICEEGHFRTTEDSFCYYLDIDGSITKWRPKLPNPEAQLKGLREKMDAISGVPNPNEQPLSVLSKLELLEIKVKKVLEEIRKWKKEAKFWQSTAQDYLASLVEIQRLAKERRRP